MPVKPRTTKQVSRPSKLSGKHSLPVKLAPQKLDCQDNRDDSDNIELERRLSESDTTNSCTTSPRSSKDASMEMVYKLQNEITEKDYLMRESKLVCQTKSVKAPLKKSLRRFMNAWIDGDIDISNLPIVQKSYKATIHIVRELLEFDKKFEEMANLKEYWNRKHSLFDELLQITAWKRGRKGRIYEKEILKSLEEHKKLLTAHILQLKSNIHELETTSNEPQNDIFRMRLDVLTRVKSDLNVQVNNRELEMKRLQELITKEDDELLKINETANEICRSDYDMNNSVNETLKLEIIQFKNAVMKFKSQIQMHKNYIKQWEVEEIPEIERKIQKERLETKELENSDDLVEAFAVHKQHVLNLHESVSVLDQTANDKIGQVLKLELGVERRKEIARIGNEQISLLQNHIEAVRRETWELDQKCMTMSKFIEV